MNIIQSVVLALLEGITEFLPVSSTGHLILASNVLKIPQTEFVKSFEIIIQLGAILAVVVLYFKKLISSFDIWKKILTAFIPTIIAGAFLYDFIKAFLLGNSLVVVWSLLIGGIVMTIFERLYKEQKSPKKIQLKHYLLIGFFQVISMIPGVSRAFATIFGGMVVGLNRKQATEFSFFLAIPTMFAASAIDIYKTDVSVWSSSNITLLLIGFVGSFITALITIKWLLKFVQTNNFIGFGAYRIILALAFLLLI